MNDNLPTEECTVKCIASKLLFHRKSITENHKTDFYLGCPKNLRGKTVAPKANETTLLVKKISSLFNFQ